MIATAMTSITRTDDPTETILRLGEVLDATTAPVVSTVFDAVVAAQGPSLVLDCGALRNLDSIGVRCVLALHRGVREYGGTLEVRNLSHQPRTMFHLLRIERLLSIQPSS